MTAALDPDSDAFDLENLWFGTHNGVREGNGGDAVAIDDTARCGVDITLYEPASPQTGT